MLLGVARLWGQGDGLAEAARLRSEGMALIEAGRFAEADIPFGAALRHYAQAGDWPAYVGVMEEAFPAYYYTGTPDSMAAALNRREAVIQRYLAPGDWETFWLRYHRSILVARQGNMLESVAQLEQALRLLDSLGSDTTDRVALARSDCYNAIAVALYHLGNLDRARVYYERRLDTDLRLRGPDHPKTAQTYNNLGLTYWELGDLARALGYFERSLAIKRSKLPPGHPSIAQTLNNIATLYRDEGDYVKALAAFREALELERGVFGEKSYTVGQRYGGISIVLRDMGRYAEARTYSVRALDIFRQTLGPHHPHLARARSVEADLQARQGHYDAALEMYQQAIVGLVPGFKPTSVLDNPSASPLVTGQYVIEMLTHKGRLLQSRYATEPDATLLVAALDCFDKAILLSEQLVVAFEGEGTRLSRVERSRNLYEQAIGLCYELSVLQGGQDYVHRAFGYAERGKAAVLRTSLQAAAALQSAGIPAEVQAEEKTRKDRLVAASQHLFDREHEAGSDSLAYWREQVFEAQQAYDAFIERLETTYPAYYQLKRASTVPDLAAVQACLKRTGGQLLAYFYGAEYLYGFRADPDTLLWFRQAQDQGLDLVADSLIGQLGDHARATTQAFDPVQYAQFGRQAHALYRQLVAPLAPVPGRDLLISPDGKLHFFPFDLLLTTAPQPGSEPRYDRLAYLLRDFPILTLYATATLTDAAAASSSTRVGGLAAFAPSYTHLSGGDAAHPASPPNTGKSHYWPPLLYTAVELEAIRSRTRATLFMGSAASEQGFREQAPHYSLLHLAMHAYTDEQSPLQSALIFDPSQTHPDYDGVLYAYELAHLRLSADLVVLSACNTGGGKWVGGEGVLSLARAFYYAGCPNVLMSLWPCDDRSTSRLMAHFYEALAQDTRPAHALRAAKLAYLDARKDLFPHFWGAFVYQGRQEVVALPTRSHTWLLLPVGAVLAMSGAGLWWWRKKRLFRRSARRPFAPHLH
ncbi:MAG: CHAT domain-containing protein [Bacteroidia bacterium]